MARGGGSTAQGSVSDVRRARWLRPGSASCRGMHNWNGAASSVWHRRSGPRSRQEDQQRRATRACPARRHPVREPPWRLAKTGPWAQRQGGASSYQCPAVYRAPSAAECWRAAVDTGCRVFPCHAPLGSAHQTHPRDKERGCWSCWLPIGCEGQAGSFCPACSRNERGLCPMPRQGERLEKG